MEWNEQRVLICFATLILIGMVTMFGLGYAEERSRHSVKVDPTNRHKFSDVFVLLDGTRSMEDTAFSDAKEIVKDHIIPSVGINDRITCYALSGRFNHNVSSVFGKTHQEQPPQLNEFEAEEIVELYQPGRDLRQPTVRDDDTVSFFEKLTSKQQEVKAKHQQWQSKVDLLQRPTIPGSDYGGALEGIRRQLSDKNNRQRETWLFIVGDLKNEETKSHPVYEGDPVFENVRIVLVYPFDSVDDWNSIKKFWKSYFGEIEFEERPFGVALREKSLIAPNATVGLEIQRGEKFWTVMRPFIIADGVILLVSVVLFVIAGKRSQKAEPVQNPDEEVLTIAVDLLTTEHPQPLTTEQPQSHKEKTATVNRTSQKKGLPPADARAGASGPS